MAPSDGRKSKEKPDALIPPVPSAKKTTDELIEEYEKKINKTKSLLEEEKNRATKLPDRFEQPPSHQELLNNLTPEFKKQNANDKKKPTQPPQVLQNAQMNSYISDMPTKGVLAGQENAKLLKQIKNCFNDNSLGNHGLGMPSLSTTPQGAPVSKSKQKLNKSYENLFAANKSKTQADSIARALQAKKNLSTSPRRGSSSGKKSGSSRGGGNKKKYL